MSFLLDMDPQLIVLVKSDQIW